MKKNIVLLTSVMLAFAILLTACGDADKESSTDTTITTTRTTTWITTAAKGEDEQAAPEKEEVLAMREVVLEGMTESDIQNLCYVIKTNNYRLEWNVVWENFFSLLSEPDYPIWNYFDETGEIQIGWAYDSEEEKQATMEEENLTENEYYEKYGERVVTTNDYDAEDIAQIIENLRDTVVNEALRYDLQQIADEVRLAAETHDVEHAKKMYYLIHDMDYWLLNYSLDKQTVYVRDKSTIEKYYGVLSVWEQ